MFKDNLISLRKLHNLSQEELAEIFDVSLDDLVNYDKEVNGLGVPPRGKHIFGMVKVGEKGQIVIPAKARKIFHIESGDKLIVLGDESQGIALINEKEFMKMVWEFKKTQE